MKKLLSVILAFTMICSCFAMPFSASAETITEAERKAILAEKEYTYIDINPNIDAFASISVIRDYATFNKAEVSGDAFNASYTNTNSAGEEYTYKNQIPSKTHDGKTTITGEEGYYKKGISNSSIDSSRIGPMLFVTESFKMTAEELKNVDVKYYKGLDSDASIKTSKVAANPDKYPSQTTHFESADYNYLPNVLKTEEAGDNYYVYLKANKADAQFKIGPINDKEYVKNALDFIKESSKAKINLPAGTKGKKLAVAITTGEINNGSGYGSTSNGVVVGEALNLGSSNAAIVPFEIGYKSGTTEKHYVVVSSMIQTIAERDDLVGATIYYGNKYDADGNEIDYKSQELYHKSKNETSPLTPFKNSGYTFDDIQFPSNMMTSEMNVAIGLRARQDTVANNYGNKASVGVFDLKDEEVSHIRIINEQTPGDNTDIKGVIGLDNGTESYPRALIPVTFDGADPNKVYFLYVARISAAPAVLGATISGESLQDKIDALNATLSALDSKTLTEADIAGYKAQVAALVAESEYILESDFDISKLTEAEKRIEDEKLAAEKEAALNVRYTTVDTLSLPQDLFATKAEVMSNSNWYNVDSTAAAPNAYAYKGFSQDSSEKKYPNAKFGFAFSIDGLNSLAEISEENGTYTYTLAGVPFKLGTIEEGKVGNNAYIIRTHFDATKTSDDVVVNAPSTTAPAVYTGTSPMNYATYTINKSGISEVNLLMTDVYVKDASDNKLVRAYIKYEGEKEIPVYLIVANAQTSFADKVYVIKKSDYEAIKTNDSLITMKDKDELTLEEYKELIRKYVGDAEADATTSIPKNWTSDVSAVGNAVWKALCEETKYKDVMDLNPGKIGDILSNVDQSKFASVYQDIATVLPSASGKFVDVNMKTTWSNTYKSYVSNIAVPVDSTKKVEYIKFDSNLVRPNEAILGGGGFNQLGDYNTDLGMLMLSYNGSNTITKDGVEYVMFAKLKRQCADTILFGATLTNAKTTLDHIADLNAELEAIDVETITLEECEALRAKIAELKAVSSYITDADFNTEKLEAAEEAFKADRLSKTVYAPIEMDMPNDYFATRAERGGSSDTFWFDGTKPYNAYLGYLGINDKLPMTRIKYSNGNVISVDGKADTALNKIATLKDGRYVLPMGEVPYRLGEITENVLDGNAFEPGLQILKSDTNLLNSKIDDRYTTSLSSDTSYYTVQAGKFPVTVPNANKVNVLTTSMTNGTTSGPFGLYTVNALVHLDDGTYVGYILLTAPGCTNKAGRNINQSVLFVPKNSGLTTYADIKAAVGGEVKTLEDMTKYHYSDVKLPGASAVQGSSISRYHNVGLTDTRQVDRKFYYDNLIMPEETKMIYRDFGYTVDGFVSSFEIEAPAGRTITAVEFIHDGGSTLRDGYAPAVNALADGSGSTASMFLVPSTLAGVEDYDVYVAITRNCRYSAILGMTAEATGAEAVAGLNTLMANAKTSADIEAVEALKAYIDGENVLESDLDAKSVAAYETAKQNINVEGTIEVSFEEGALASALVTINNITKLAGKPYKVILAYYNEDESQLLGTKVVSGLSTTDAKATFTVDGDNMPGGTKVVKGFLWKDFTTLVPLTPVSK